MITKTKIIFLGITITLIFIFLYISLRFTGFEKNYVKSLISTSRRIAVSVNSFQKEKILKEKNLEFFLKKTHENMPHIALSAISDTEKRIVTFNKNYRYFESNELTDTVLQDFQNDILKLGGKVFLIRYYNRIKYYIFIENIYDGKILMLFPYRLDKAAKINIALELALIVIISLLTISLLYIYLQKTGRINTGLRFQEIDTSRKSGVSSHNNKTKREVEKLTGDSLKNYVYELFNKLNAKYSPDTVTLFINRNENILAKSYELKGKAFFKIDSEDFGSIDIDNEIGEELKKSSTLVLENSKRILIPMMYKSSLIGAVEIIRQNSFTGTETSDIKIEVGGIASLLSDQILLKDVVIDMETGLYSKSYFKMKYDELIKSYQNTRRDFAIILIMTIDNKPDLTPEEIALIIKTASHRVNELLNANDILIRHDNNMLLLLPEANSISASEISGNLLEALKNLKIKAGKKILSVLNPYIGFASTDELNEEEDLLERARKNLEYAASRNESEIQSINIKKI